LFDPSNHRAERRWGYVTEASCTAPQRRQPISARRSDLALTSVSSNVNGVTTLTGAALALIADALLNSLKTSALVTSDLENASSWQAKSFGCGINLSTTDFFEDAVTGDIQPSLSQNAQGSSSGTAVVSIAPPGTIIILDAATQQILTSMTPEEAIAAVNRAAAAQNKAADKLSSLSQTLNV